MSWRIIITVPDSKIGSTLNNLRSAGVKFRIEPMSEHALTDNGEDLNPPKVGPNAILSLGPKEPMIGTVSGRIVALLERLEKQKGAHRVTRAMLNAAMKKQKFSPSELSTGVTNALGSRYLSVHGVADDELTS